MVYRRRKQLNRMFMKQLERRSDQTQDPSQAPLSNSSYSINHTEECLEFSPNVEEEIGLRFMAFKSPNAASDWYE